MLLGSTSSKAAIIVSVAVPPMYCITLSLPLCAIARSTCSAPCFAATSIMLSKRGINALFPSKENLLEPTYLVCKNFSKVSLSKILLRTSLWLISIFGFSNLLAIQSVRSAYGICMNSAPIFEQYASFSFSLSLKTFSSSL